VGFLRRVLGRSVPAGLVIAGATMGVFSLVQLDSRIDEHHASTVAVLVAGSVALENLVRVAQPLNRWRRTLVATMIVAFALAFVLPAGRRIFELPTTQWWAYLVGAAFIAASWPLLVLGSRVTERWHGLDHAGANR
jgi:hypothetical protein